MRYYLKIYELVNRFNAYHSDRNKEQRASENHAHNTCDPQTRKKFLLERSESIERTCKRLRN
jgi:hypothetical protein